MAAEATAWIRATSYGRLGRYLGMSRNSGAIPELDGLRAFAILLVLGRHAVRPFWAPEAPLLPLAGLDWDMAIPFLNGWLGVDLFFVLSGFLITHHIMRHREARLGRIDLGDYLTKRVLRIFPAYFTMLGIAAAGLVPLYDPGSEYLAERIGYHVLFLQDYLPSNIVVAFWSLGVEEKFYLLAPLLLAAILRLPLPGLQYAAMSALIATPLLARYFTYLGTPGASSYETFFPIFRSPFHVCFDGLAIGMLCALLYRDRTRLAWATRRHVPRILFWSGLSVLGSLLLTQPLLEDIGTFDKTLLQTVIALGAGCMLLGAVLGGGPSNFLGQGWLLFFSRISYSLYLVHMPLIPGARLLVESIMDLDRFSPSIQFLIFLPVFSAISIAAALALHYIVEKPFLILKDSTHRGDRARQPGRESFQSR